MAVDREDAFFWAVLGSVFVLLLYMVGMMTYLVFVSYELGDPLAGVPDDVSVIPAE